VGGGGFGEKGMESARERYIMPFQNLFSDDGWTM
jgi:hypothetical protein